MILSFHILAGPLRRSKVRMERESPDCGTRISHKRRPGGFLD